MCPSLRSTTGGDRTGFREGKLESEIRDDWSELLDTWKRAPETVQMPEGETIQDVWARSVRS